ncbi:hypothetical protein [Polaribacter sp.]|uniref:hypothetical protein n=1 Tax=Polaribacter sp. TaxID=1920175 RepID=UPI003F6D4709
MKERNKKLKKRVEFVKKELDSLQIKNPKHFFGLKNPEYLGDNHKEERLKNLWYCRVFDEDFTKKMESFLTFKKTQYK